MEFFFTSNIAGVVQLLRSVMNSASSSCLQRPCMVHYAAMSPSLTLVYPYMHR